MKRYYPVVTYGRGTIPNAEMEESDTGDYVLASEALAEIERLSSKLAVLGGEACQAGRKEGRGGCGMCALCCKELRDEIERLRAAYEWLHSQVGGYLHGKDWDHWKQWNDPRAVSSLTPPTPTPNCAPEGTESAANEQS